MKLYFTFSFVLILFLMPLQSQESSNQYRKFTMNGLEYQTNGVDTICIIEPMPEYQGGIDAMHSFISRKLKYPVDLYDEKVEGSVTLKFAIDEEGRVQNIEVTESTDTRFNEAAVEVIQKMKKWKPGKQNGKPVKVYFTMPINFTL